MMNIHNIKPRRIGRKVIIECGTEGEARQVVLIFSMITANKKMTKKIGKAAGNLNDG